MTPVTPRESNWAGNVTYSAARLHRPTTPAELQQIVAHSDRAHALGTRHSFNRVADTAGDLIDVTGLPVTVEVDSSAGQVRVSGGTTYGELATRLHTHGLALPNLGSLPHISVAGACATGTHGSGDGNGCLATSVSSLELVTATGDVVEISRGTDHFAGAVVSLGALGVVTALTLDVQPAYEVTQHVYDDLPAHELATDLDGVFASAYSVSVFTRWRGDTLDQVWLKQRAGEDPPGDGWRGTTKAETPRHPVPGVPAAQATQQGTPGPWHQRLPHFRADATPSAGDELQSEYLVPRRHGVDAIAAVASMRESVAPVLQISELRTVAADDLWLSPGYARDSLALHFTWVPDEHTVLPVVRALEERLAPFAARPHWGKVFTTSRQDLWQLFERAPSFVDLMHHYDPDGTFRNPMLDEHFPVRT